MIGGVWNMALFNWKKREGIPYEKDNSILCMPERELQSSVENTDRNGEDKEFDLNIEKILENWEVYHAIREIIANALDEQIITGTQDIQIIKKIKSGISLILVVELIIIT